MSRNKFIACLCYWLSLLCLNAFTISYSLMNDKICGFVGGCIAAGWCGAGLAMTLASRRL